MTVVFERGAPPQEPVTHAFVVGCGRFPGKPALNRDATVAGARAIMKFIAAHADQFVTPLWTIECLISDPKVTEGPDTLGVELEGPTGAMIAEAGTVVDPVTLENAEATGDHWLDRIRPGDHAFVYVSSHGIADGVSALALCEDVLTTERRKWSQSINVSTLAVGLTTSLGRAARGWVFLDACQEIVPALLGAPTGVPGLNLIELDAKTAGGATNTVGVVGSSMGGKAWAPTSAEPPFFTQALIEGFENSCVEPVPEIGWAVTAQRLIFDLPRVAEAALGRGGMETEPLTRFRKPLVGLLRVENPMIPVALSTEIEAHLAQAKIDVTCDDPNVEPKRKEAGGEEMVWRFRVEANRKRSFTAEATFAAGIPEYKPAKFDSDPPCVTVLLRSAV